MINSLHLSDITQCSLGSNLRIYNIDAVSLCFKAHECITNRNDQTERRSSVLNILSTCDCLSLLFAGLRSHPHHPEVVGTELGEPLGCFCLLGLLPFNTVMDGTDDEAGRRQVLNITKGFVSECQGVFWWEWMGSAGKNLLDRGGYGICTRVVLTNKWYWRNKPQTCM